jgi:DNA-binding response OmpR family regulator
MSAALKQHGYVTFLANDGLEALDVLEKTNIDLIISDIMMPNMDGYELTRQLRKADFNLPILMVTAKETFEDKQEGFSAGTDDYMVKPFDFRELLARLAAEMKTLGDEGFLIRTFSIKNRQLTLVAANTDAGLLYGAYHLLRLIQTNGISDKISINEKPSY